MVGVGIALAHLEHGALHGVRHPLPLLEPRVEGDHEVLGAFVVNVPEAENQGLRSRLEEAADQTDQFVARRDHIQSSRASTQNHQFGRQLEVINVIKAQVGVSEPNRREHRIVLPEIAVSGDMDNAAGAALGS